LNPKRSIDILTAFLESRRGFHRAQASLGVYANYSVPRRDSAVRNGPLDRRSGRRTAAQSGFPKDIRWNQSPKLRYNNHGPMILDTAVTSPLCPPVPDADTALVRRVADGDIEAHRLLYERFGREILAYLVGRLGDRPAAEELLQEIMLDLWHRSAARFRGESRVRTWLLAIAHHRACNELRRRSRLTVAEDPAAIADAVPAGRGGRPSGPGRPDDLIDLEQAIVRLPEIQRAALELVFYHGLSIEEAAAVMDCAPGTVKSRLSRAKTQLRADLTGEPHPSARNHDEYRPEEHRHDV
jgi:RNA polymerase sigma-70 factor (ECF subfamily)